ncbi:hypothetical protein WR25_24513 [Diploscapter pachys]|uniref:Sushi domain-containing protein n=1 Tax=Diploscapter pachys TaxID=2018661 RepID=A0A2A2L805_9BILA|nr:hypothetical protein WR25_24513 [Diploscapter pachys]
MHNLRNFCLKATLNLCPLPLIKNGHVIEVRSVPSLGPWQHNTTLSFACNRPYSNQLQQSVCFHGKWEPEPECKEMFCPAPESAFHRNAMLKTDINSSMSVSFLSRLDYSAPPQVYPVEPFRLCDFNEQSALQWIDYNFGFSEPCDPPIVTPTINCDNCLHGFKTQWQDGSQHCECEPGYVIVGENTCIVEMRVSSVSVSRDGQLLDYSFIFVMNSTFQAISARNHYLAARHQPAVEMENALSLIQAKQSASVTIPFEGGIAKWL